MMPDELEDYARTLTAEVDRLAEKIARLDALRPPAPPAQIKRLSAQRERLLALRDEAWHRLGPSQTDRRG